ncbi:MAG TPA: hypothetical protein VHS78_07815 [Candidatus Elarobacter sp.]|jgi:hypothetical protein|nr:hypothetical protein [Candidatus Elarobacter sp.]
MPTDPPIRRLRTSLRAVATASLVALAACGHGATTTGDGATGGASGSGRPGGAFPEGIATNAPHSGVYRQAKGDDPCCWLAKTARFTVAAPAGAKQLAFKFFVPGSAGDYDRSPASVTIAVAGGPTTTRDHLGPGFATIVVPLAKPATGGQAVSVTMGRTFVPPGGPASAPISIMLISASAS